VTISYSEFEKIELRSGTIVRVEPFSKARNPSYKVWVDFGSTIGIKQTAAQVTVHNTPEWLIGKQVMGCINLGERNIAGFMSEFLLVGFSDEKGAVCLTTCDPKVPNGQKLF
jgi:tRNA-binding protein